jgi:hypothetical protein
MSLEGTFVNGVVVLDGGAALPEGTRVEVAAKNNIAKPETKEEGNVAPTFLDMLEFAGCMPELPADFASHHDHYIHGTAK